MMRNTSEARLVCGLDQLASAECIHTYSCERPQGFRRETHINAAPSNHCGTVITILMHSSSSTRQLPSLPRRRQAWPRPRKHLSVGPHHVCLGCLANVVTISSSIASTSPPPKMILSGARGDQVDHGKAQCLCSGFHQPLDRFVAILDRLRQGAAADIAEIRAAMSQQVRRISTICGLYGFGSNRQTTRLGLQVPARPKPLMRSRY